MKYFIPILTALSIFLVSACHSKQKTEKDFDSRWQIPQKTEEQALKIKNRLDQLAYLMEGSFSSEKQATEDPLGYYNIVTHIYSIWKERTDAKYFYVEQATASMPDEPYRQRIYRVSSITQDSFRSEIFSFPNPENYVGAWRTIIDKKATTNIFSKLKFTELTKKDGCDVFLEWMSSGIYIGQNKVGTCLSSRKDSQYMITDVRISFTRFITWDRGFGADGKQSWGPDAGYNFDRMSKEKILELLKKYES